MSSRPTRATRARPINYSEEVVIAKAGRPLVRLVPVQDRSEVRRGGFLQGAAVVRAALKADFTSEIDSLFG